MRTALVLIASAVLSSPSVAQQTAQAEARPVAGTELLLKADFENAERELRAVPGPERDVARSINLGVVLAKLGRFEEAERRFQRVIVQDDVELILSDGQTIGSQDAARRALGALKRGDYGR